MRYFIYAVQLFNIRAMKMDQETKRGGGGGRGLEVFMRALAVALTVAAAVVMGVDKQTKMVALSLVPGLPPKLVPLTAKSSYQSAFVYLVAANSIASVFAALTLLLTLVRRQASAHTTILKAAGDMVIAALLFSATGAAGAVGVLGYKGNSHVMWNKVCNQFGRFCNGALASFVLSFLGSTVFLLLVLLAFHNLRRN